MCYICENVYLMLKGLIVKYEPINTVEKVDALIADMQASNMYITSTVSFEVLMHIKKAKIQMYFRDTIQPLIKTEPKVNPIINASANRVTFNGGFNIEFVGSDRSSVKHKNKSEAQIKREEKKLAEEERRKAEKKERKKKNKELKRKLAEEKYRREHEFSPQFGCLVKKTDATSKGVFDPNDDEYQGIAKRARSSQVIRNYDGKKSCSVHMMFIPSGGQNKKY